MWNLDFLSVLGSYRMIFSKGNHALTYFQVIILADVKIMDFKVTEIEAGRGSHCSGNSVSSRPYMFQLFPACHLQNGFSADRDVGSGILFHG